MVQLEVYGYARSTCTQRVLILLEELELKYSFNEVDITAGEQQSKEYLELQPFGKVPYVVYGDRPLFESRSILRYISKLNRDIEDFHGGVNVDMWLEVESQNFSGPSTKILYERAWKKDGEPDKSVIEASLEQLGRVLDVYEKRLEHQDYIAGDDFSIADISHIPYIYLMLKYGYKDVYKTRPNVYNWIKLILRRPAVRKVIEVTK
jgi:glutathione S-transferase